MKIAYLVHDYHRAGGHSRYVAELASRFVKEHEVHVFANRIEPDGTKGIHFHKVPAWRANALSTVVTFALPSTFQISPNFDIIHSQGFCAFRGNVFTTHRCNRAWHLALQEFEGGATFRESVFNTTATMLEHAIYRSRRKAAVIAISERVARDIVRFYHCRTPIPVIHHGVDLERFSPNRKQSWRSDMRKLCQFADDDFVFLYVGNLRKGADRCIRALARLPRGRLAFV
jgi:glycosyltransferase involved in cell wall biosynthesis